MIVILEGLRGAGKTTVAVELSKTLGANIVRPFRRDLSHHHDDARRFLTGLPGQLAELGVPVNTYVEDMYVAEILGGISSEHQHFILDRTIISAVVHSSFPSDIDITRLLQLWQTLIARAGKVYYIYMFASYEAACRRVRGRPMPPPAEYLEARERFDDMYNDIVFRKTFMDTTKMSAESSADLILDWLRKQETSQ